MKKLVLIKLFIVLTFVACGSDDGNNSSSENDSELVGIWQLTSRTEIGVREYTLDNCELTSTFDFKSDNSYIEKTFVEISGNCQSDGQFEGKWSINGDILKLEFSEFGEQTVNNPKLQISNNELIITFTEIEEKYKKL